MATNKSGDSLAGTFGLILGLAILIAQGMILKNMYASSARNAACEPIPLSADVKSYIDSKVGGGAPEEAAQLFKRVADLEQTAGRLDYLRSTLTALEESQSRLGRMTLEQPIAAADVITAARDRELQKFRIGLEKICASSEPTRVKAQSGFPSSSSSSSSTVPSGSSDAGDK